jgi:hypothetical protein
MNMISRFNTRFSIYEKYIILILFICLASIDSYGTMQLCIFVGALYLIELFVTQR